ncbi:hypothetical protein GF377_01080, partial [candidate division GN15 bacterium]|nr:hypothetical protein [candidate division GN15 bacterium]
MYKSILAGCGLSLCLFLILPVLGSSQTLSRVEHDELVTVFDSARVQEADIFAPVSYERASRELAEAEEAIDRNKRQSTLDKHVRKAREHIENALKATSLAKVSLNDYLEPRDKARAAKAPTLVPLLWSDAEQQFMKATRKVEEGDVKDALKEAEKAKPLYDTAELEGIRADILGDAKTLIEKAEADEAPKYALATLNKARGALEKGNAILNRDRYNRADAEEQAAIAEYEARHASNIAQSVRSLERNDQAWEKLMLVYEIEMNRVGKALGLEYLRFDDGPIAAADTLIGRIQAIEKENSLLYSENAEVSSGVISELKRVLQTVGEEPVSEDPVRLAEQVGQAMQRVKAEKAAMVEEMQVQQSQMAQLSQEHEEVSEALDTRLERERRFKEAKQLLDPSEGEVLFNAANDIVLRLSGLAFGIGKSDISEDQIPL